MILIEQTSLPPIEDVSRRMLRLAGTRIDPASNGRFTTSFDRGLALRRVDADRPRALPVPDGGRLASVSWSHDSRHLVWTVVTDQGTELWGGGWNRSPGWRLVSLGCDCAVRGWLRTRLGSSRPSRVPMTLRRDSVLRLI